MIQVWLYGEIDNKSVNMHRIALKQLFDVLGIARDSHCRSWRSRDARFIKTAVLYLTVHALADHLAQEKCVALDTSQMSPWDKLVIPELVLFSESCHFCDLVIIFRRNDIPRFFD